MVREEASTYLYGAQVCGLACRGYGLRSAPLARWVPGVGPMLAQASLHSCVGILYCSSAFCVCVCTLPATFISLMCCTNRTCKDYVGSLQATIILR